MRKAFLNQGGREAKGQKGKALLSLPPPEAVGPGDAEVAVDQIQKHQVKAPLTVKEGEGEVGEASPLLQGDQVQDHQEPGFGAPSPSGPVQGLLGFLPSEADEGTGGPGVAVQEAGEGGGGFGPGVLGSGLAVASKQEEEQGFQGSLEVEGWQEGQDAGE